MVFTRKLRSVSFDYRLEDQALKAVTQFKDLGVMFSTNLSFSTHTEDIAASANKR